MTESDWQGDMLRRMADESPGDTAGPAQGPENPPSEAAQPAPAGSAVPEQPAVAEPFQQQPPHQQPPQEYQPPYGQQQYPAPPGQVAPYQPAPYEQYPAAPYQPAYQDPQYQQAPPQYPQQPDGIEPDPYQEPHYPPYHQQPPGQVPYQVPQQPYPPHQSPPYQQQPGGYQQQPYPPQYQEPQPPPYQPPPAQYPQPYAPQSQYQQPQYQQPQYQQPQYQPPVEQYHQQPYPPPPGPPGTDGGWGPPPAPPPGDGGWGPPPPQHQAFNPNAPVEPGVDQPGDSDSVFRRFRRIASEAAYLVGASGRMQRDVDNIATIRRPIAIMRRVGVLSPVTQSGTSTVTALLALTLAAQRSDRVVALDADPNEAELSRRLELSIGAGPLERVGLVQAEPTAEGVRAKLAEVQGSGARDVALAVVDCPGTMFDEISSSMASNGHATVLVVPSVQHAAEYALSQLDQLPPAGQDLLLTRGIVVISLSANVSPESVAWLVEAFRQRGMDPVVLPYDPHVATAWPLRSEELQQETRRALLDLSARVVATVTGTTN